MEAQQQKQPQQVTEDVKAARVIADRLRGHNISPDDPAFLVLQSTELAARMLERLPLKLEDHTSQRIAELDRAVAAAMSTGLQGNLAELAKAKDDLIEAVKAQSQSVTKQNVQAAIKSISTHNENAKFGYIAAYFAFSGLIAAASFFLGRITANLDFTGGAGAVGIAENVLNAPIALIVLPAIAATIAFKFWR